MHPEKEEAFRIRDLLVDWLAKHKENCPGPCAEPANLMAYLCHCMGIKTTSSDFFAELSLYEHNCPASDSWPVERDLLAKAISANFAFRSEKLPSQDEVDSVSKEAEIEFQRIVDGVRGNRSASNTKPSKEDCHFIRLAVFKKCVEIMDSAIK